MATLTATQKAQLDTAKATLLRMQAGLKDGSLVPKSTTTTKAPVIAAKAPATSSTAVSPTLSRYTPTTTNMDAQYKMLQQAMAPSREEGQLNDQNAQLNAQLRNLSNGQGVMNRNIADQPINLGFITGQQRSNEERYALQRGDVTNRQQTLQEQLANLQKKRQSAIDVAREGLNYGTNKDSILNTGQQYNNTLASQQDATNFRNTSYADSLKQQGLDNTFRDQTEASRLAQQSYSNSLRGTSGGGSTGGGSSVPDGGYDSSQGTNFLTAPKKTVLTSVQSMFAPATSTKIQSQLTDEQLRLFMNDYTETQNQQQQSIMPEWYLEQWKAAAGVGGSPSSGRSV